MYLRFNTADLPRSEEEVRDDFEVSFKIEDGKVTATKFIHRKKHKITKKLSCNGIDYLWKVLENIANLPDEFWQIDY